MEQILNEENVENYLDFCIDRRENHLQLNQYQKNLYIFRNPSHEHKLCLFSISVFSISVYLYTHDETDCGSKQFRKKKED